VFAASLFCGDAIITATNLGAFGVEGIGVAHATV
jgi:hypothetical protein